MTIPRLGLGLMKNARIWLTTALCLATFVAGQASLNASEESQTSLIASKVFAEAPLEVLDMIRPSARLDMLDYYTQADSILTVANALGGESRLEQLTQDYLKVEVTPVSTLEIKLLQAGKKLVVMTLYTTGDGDMAQDTEIRFFDAQLRPIDPKKFLKAPALADFFTLKGSGISEEDLKEKVPYAAVSYSVGPGDQPLTATLTTLRVISEDDRDLLTAIMTPTLSAPWKGKYNFIKR